MKLSFTINSLWRSSSQIVRVGVCSVALLSLISCGSGGSGSAAHLRWLRRGAMW